MVFHFDQLFFFIMGVDKKASGAVLHTFQKAVRIIPEVPTVSVGVGLTEQFSVSAEYIRQCSPFIDISVP